MKWYSAYQFLKSVLDRAWLPVKPWPHVIQGMDPGTHRTGWFILYSGMRLFNSSQLMSTCKYITKMTGIPIVLQPFLSKIQSTKKPFTNKWGIKLIFLPISHCVQECAIHGNGWKPDDQKKTQVNKQ